MSEPTATVTEFNPDDFRKVGAVAEFNPEWLSGKGKAIAGRPVRVTKVNPKSIKVETEDGQIIVTDAWMLVPTDKPFTRAEDAVRITAASLVRITGRLRLTGGSDGLWVALASPAIDGKVKVARLGGDGGKYFTLPASVLTVVDPAEVLR